MSLAKSKLLHRLGLLRGSHVAAFFIFSLQTTSALANENASKYYAKYFNQLASGSCTRHKSKNILIKTAPLFRSLAHSSSTPFHPYLLIAELDVSSNESEGVVVVVTLNILRA